MLNYKLTQYSEGKSCREFVFFILCKGKNAGKPMHKPTANCFVCEAKNQEESELLYWICYALWKGKNCERELIGSVIPYIRIQTMDKLIQERLDQINPECPHFKKRMLLLRYLEQNMKKHLSMIEKLKQLEVTAAAGL